MGLIMFEKFYLVVSANINKKYFIKLTNSKGLSFLYNFSLPSEEIAKEYAESIKFYGKKIEHYTAQYLRKQQCYIISLRMDNYVVLGHKSHLPNMDEANKKIRFLVVLFKQ